MPPSGRPLRTTWPISLPFSSCSTTVERTGLDLRATRILSVTGRAVLLIERFPKFRGGFVRRSAEPEKIAQVALLRSNRTRENGQQEKRRGETESQVSSQAHHFDSNTADPTCVNDPQPFV